MSTEFNFNNNIYGGHNINVHQGSFQPQGSLRMRGFERVSQEFAKHPELDIVMPKRGSKWAAGYDITSPTQLIIAPGEMVVVYTDLRAYMPPNERLMIYPRSSLRKKNLKLDNTVGIVDSDYYDNPDTGGNIMVLLKNTSFNLYATVEAGERIVQGIFETYLLADGDDFDTGDIRQGGYGSTGTM